jgi:putative molybdopterin biosynthesis protein
VAGVVDGRWVGHRLGAGDSAAFAAAADGVVSGVRQGGARSARLTLFDDVRSADRNLLCAGCAPAFGILATRANAAREGGRAIWLERSSGAALDLLERGHVHVAGAHLYDEDAQEFNVPFVERRFSGRSMLIFNLARWDVGLVVAAGNPRRIRRLSDLARRDVSFVGRQPGAAAQDLIERMLRGEGLRPAGVMRPRMIAHGHAEVARLVALGLGDAGISLPAMARAQGLAFIPLGEERFDLVVSKDLATDTRIVRLLDTLAGRAFRREMESLGGHMTRQAGRLIAETGAARGAVPRAVV